MLPLLLAAAQSWTFATGAAPSVALENLFGSIRVERGREGEVSIEATVSGEDLASPGRWKLSAERARDGSIAAGASCEDVRSTDGVARCSRAAIAWVLRVPSDAGVRIESILGDVEVSAGRSISVTSVCGKVRLAPAAVLQRRGGFSSPGGWEEGSSLLEKVWKASALRARGPLFFVLAILFCVLD